MAGGSPLKCRAPYLHGVVGVLVVEDEGLLAELVVSLQLVDVGFVVDDVLLVLLQAVHLFLQGAGDVHGHVADLLREHTGGRPDASFKTSLDTFSVFICSCIIDERVYRSIHF